LAQATIKEQTKLTVKTTNPSKQDNENRSSELPTHRYKEPYSPNIFIYKNQLKEQQQNMIRMKQKMINQKEKTACQLKKEV